MSRYADMDAEILRLLADQPLTWGQVHSRLTRSFPGAFPTNPTTEWRLTDRRLQSLRKAGKIKSERERSTSVWSLT